MLGEIGGGIFDKHRGDTRNDAKRDGGIPHISKSVAVTPTLGLSGCCHDMVGDAGQGGRGSGGESGDQSGDFSGGVVEGWGHDGGGDALGHRGAGFVAEDGAEDAGAHGAAEESDRSNQSVGQTDVALRHVETGGNVAVNEDPAEGNVCYTLEYDAQGDAIRRDEGLQGCEERLHSATDEQLQGDVLDAINQAAENGATDGTAEARRDVVVACFNGVGREDVADFLGNEVCDGNIDQTRHENDDKEGAIFSEPLEQTVGEDGSFGTAAEIPDEGQDEEDQAQDQGYDHRRALPGMLDATPEQAEQEKRHADNIEEDAEVVQFAQDLAFGPVLKDASRRVVKDGCAGRGNDAGDDTKIENPAPAHAVYQRPGHQRAKRAEHEQVELRRGQADGSIFVR